MATKALYICTESFYNEYGSDAETILSDSADEAERIWNNDIAAGDPEYELSTISYHDSNNVDLNSPDDTSDALSQTTEFLNQQKDHLFSYYDSIIVFDSRTHSDAIGRAYVGGAGRQWDGLERGVGYIAEDATDITPTHELGHIYGGDHSPSTNGDSTFSWKHYLDTSSVMGQTGEYACNGSENSYYYSDWFSDCTREAVRWHIDNYL